MHEAAQPSHLCRCDIACSSLVLARQLLCGSHSFWSLYVSCWYSLTLSPSYCCFPAFPLVVLCVCVSPYVLLPLMANESCSSRRTCHTASCRDVTSPALRRFDWLPVTTGGGADDHPQCIAQRLGALCRRRGKCVRRTNEPLPGGRVRCCATRPLLCGGCFRLACRPRQPIDIDSRYTCRLVDAATVGRPCPAAR